MESNSCNASSESVPSLTLLLRCLQMYHQGLPNSASVALGSGVPACINPSGTVTSRSPLRHNWQYWIHNVL
eukprot:4099007-Heterocapsa_arctica.AAC.1